MDNKETLNLYRSDSMLLSDSNYYKHIFKKTEKIVCAVFYILENADEDRSVDVAKATSRAVSDAAHATLDTVLRTLTCRWYAATDELYAFLSALVALESHVRVAQSSQLLPVDTADLLSFELQNVMRGLRQYLARERGAAPDLSVFDVSGAMTPAVGSAGERRRPSGHTPGYSAGQQGKGQPAAQHSERQQMIKDILSTKGQSTIKDISENIKDCSEKTIQRELNAMISAGVVQKEGERRWSKYSLADMS